MEITKGQVRSDFKYARFLMQRAEKIMKDSKRISDWSESGEAGQMALELTASASTFLAWVEEMQNN